MNFAVKNEPLLPNDKNTKECGQKDAQIDQK